MLSAPREGLLFFVSCKLAYCMTGRFEGFPFTRREDQIGDLERRNSFRKRRFRVQCTHVIKDWRRRASETMARYERPGAACFTLPLAAPAVCGGTGHRVTYLESSSSLFHKTPHVCAEWADLRVSILEFGNTVSPVADVAFCRKIKQASNQSDCKD